MKQAAALIIFLFTVLGDVYAQTPAQPTLPQLTVNLTVPAQGTSTCPTLTTGTNCIRNVGSSGNSSTDAANFQKAINAAGCGDTVVLTAGVTYSGNFTIPQTTCTNNSGWKEIQSSAMSSLPSPGNRVSSSNLSNMPVISTPNSAPAIAFLPSSNHWRVMGVEIATTYSTSGGTLWWMVGMGFEPDNYTYVMVPSQEPSNIVFDRIYMYGTTASGVPTEEGFRAEGQYFALVDSYCDNIVDNAFDAQCVAAVQGAGPFLIENNFLQATGENIMFGGSDPAITNAVPSDITIVGNLFQKNLAWKGVISNVKNLLEFKNAQRVLVDGNVLQYIWQGGQYGEVMLLRSVNQGGTCTWCVVQDITVTHNLMQHAGNGIQIAPGDGDNNALPTARILARNNLFTDISTTWGGSGTAFTMSGLEPSPFLIQNITIDHNTSFVSGYFLFMGDECGSPNPCVANTVQLTNNVSDYGLYGIAGTNTTGNGTESLTTYVTNLTYNDLVFTTSATGTFPSGTLWSGSLAGVGFTSHTGTDPNLSGNFQLTSGSAYHTVGTDGKDIGVWDWTCLRNDSTAALAGAFTPSPGCSMPGNLLIQPPTNLTATVE